MINFTPYLINSLQRYKKKGCRKPTSLIFFKKSLLDSNFSYLDSTVSNDS